MSSERKSNGSDTGLDIDYVLNTRGFSPPPAGDDPTAIPEDREEDAACNSTSDLILAGLQSAKVKSLESKQDDMSELAAMLERQHSLNEDYYITFDFFLNKISVQNCTEEMIVKAMIISLNRRRLGLTQSQSNPIPATRNGSNGSSNGGVTAILGNTNSNSSVTSTDGLSLLVKDHEVKEIKISDATNGRKIATRVTGKVFADDLRISPLSEQFNRLIPDRLLSSALQSTLNTEDPPRITRFFCSKHVSHHSVTNVRGMTEDLIWTDSLRSKFPSIKNREMPRLETTNEALSAWADEEEEKKKEEKHNHNHPIFPPRILVIIHGLKNEAKHKALRKVCQHYKTEIYIPTAIEDNKDMSHEQRIAYYTQRIHTFKPDLLIAQSSGGNVVSALVESHVWNSPTWIISARLIEPLLQSNPHLPLLLSHGKQDNLQYTRDLARQLSRCEIVSFAGDHYAQEIFIKLRNVSDLIQFAWMLRAQKCRDISKQRKSVAQRMKAALLKKVHKK